MPRLLKRSLLAIAVALVVLVLAAWAALRFVDADRFKPVLEASASRALGAVVRIHGRLGVTLGSTLCVSAADGRILGGDGTTIASADLMRAWIEVAPLFLGKVRLRRVELTRPTIAAERDSAGVLNLGEFKRAAALLGALDGSTLSLHGGTLRYGDRRSDTGFEATDVEVSASRLKIGAARRGRDFRGVAIAAEVGCGRIRSGAFSLTDLTFTVDGRDGVLRIGPLAMRMFGGNAQAGVQADLSGPVPRVQVRCSLPHFRVEEFLRTLSDRRSAEGAMDFSADLSMRGATAGELLRSATGTLSLRGSDLVLHGTDLDRVFSRYESSQNFNLVDVGAVFFAGPLGLAVTRGYSFSGLFRGSGGSSPIGTLVSEWKVERGVAQAQDVALATRRNRLAMQGGLDFVHESFADVTVAVIDRQGCARIRQTLRGSFASPVVEKPRLLSSLAGPVVRLYRTARGLFPSAPCERFYAGTVAPPK